MNWARHRRIIAHAASALVIAAGLAWIRVLPLPAIRADDPFSRFWLLLSDSGAHWGIGTLLLAAACLVAARHTGFRARAKIGLLFFASGSAAIIALVGLNEIGIKQLTKIPRPYVELLEREGVLEAGKYAALSSRKERAEYLKAALDSAAKKPFVQSLHPAIREHWIGHTGYAFPSGHSLAAFFLAALVAHLLECLFPNGRRWVWAPFLWAAGVALSRVAISAHSPLDISVGALMGGTLGYLVLATNSLASFLPLDENHAHAG